MLSIQGYIAKDLKEQGLLPEKYDDLVPHPVVVPIDVPSDGAFIPIMTSNDNDFCTISVTNAIEDPNNAWHAFDPYHPDGYSIRATPPKENYTKVTLTLKNPIRIGRDIQLRIYSTQEMLDNRTGKNGFSLTTGCWLHDNTGGYIGVAMQHTSMTSVGQFYYKIITLGSITLTKIEFRCCSDYQTTTFNTKLIMPNIILL